MTQLVLSRRPGKNDHSLILAIAFFVVACAALAGCGREVTLYDEEPPAKEAPSS